MNEREHFMTTISPAHNDGTRFADLFHTSKGRSRGCTVNVIQGYNAVFRDASVGQSSGPLV